MRYYSETTVKEILADYDEDIGGIFGELSDYDHIDLPEKHGRLIDEDALGIKDDWALVETGRIWNAPTVLEANCRQVTSKLQASYREQGE